MTGVKPILTDSSQNQEFTPETKQKAILRVVREEKAPYVDIEDIDWVKENKNRNGIIYLQAKQKQEEALLKKQLKEAFAVADKARRSQGKHTLPDFNCASNNSPTTLKKDFAKSYFGKRIEKANNKEEIATIINTNIQFSELEKRLFTLQNVHLFDIQHLTSIVDDYRKQVVSVGKGYKSMLACANNKPLQAIDLLLQNHYFNLKSRDEAVEFICLAQERNIATQSPLWEARKETTKQDSMYFTQLYLQELQKEEPSVALKKAHKKAEKEFGLIISPASFEEYIKRVIKAPYQVKKS